MNLYDQNSAIRSQKDLADFIRALREDLRNNPQTWENSDLESFLDALGAWAEDIEGYYRNQHKPMPSQPDWKLVGDILMAAKVYE